MKINGNRWALTCLSIAVITASAAFAQQQPSSSDAYQGVSQPPPDDTIVATPETEPPAEQPAAPAKPSAAIPAPRSSPSPAAPISSGSPARSATSGESNYDNTDYGAVTVPVPKKAQDSFSDPGSNPVLHEREKTDYDVVAPHPSPANELPEGTEIHVRMDNALSTTETSVGTPFQGRIIFSVLQDRRVIIPAGSTLRGRVVQVSQGHRFGPAATLRLRPDVVILPDGTAYHLHAQVYSSEAKGTKTGSEGAIKPSAHALKKTAEYGAGVGTGAMVGAELGGPAGALAGSMVGAGVITTHLLLQHPEAATVPAGSELDFSLIEPLDLTPTRN